MSPAAFAHPRRFSQSGWTPGPVRRAVAKHRRDGRAPRPRTPGDRHDRYPELRLLDALDVRSLRATRSHGFWVDRRPTGRSTPASVPVIGRQPLRPRHSTLDPCPGGHLPVAAHGRAGAIGAAQRLHRRARRGRSTPTPWRGRPRAKDHGRHRRWVVRTQRASVTRAQMATFLWRAGRRAAVRASPIRASPTSPTNDLLHRSRSRGWLHNEHHGRHVADRPSRPTTSSPVPR